MKSGVDGVPRGNDPSGNTPAGKPAELKRHALQDPASSAPAFKDHFSAVADAYAASRPEYPEALFDAIAVRVPGPANVWEPGCGSGQATRGLAARFAHVHASDPSARQIAQHWAVDCRAGRDPPLAHGVDEARPAATAPRAQWRVDDCVSNVTLQVGPAERTTLPDASVQLVAVAQALHWFDRERFFSECDRVLTPGGVLAAWGYADFIAPDGMIDAVAAFRAQIEPHWPPERAQIDAHYAGYDWPFPALPAPTLGLEAEWSLAHFLRYLSSLSASARCLASTGDDPVARHAPRLAAAWGGTADVRVVQWPLFLHVRRKP